MVSVDADAGGEDLESVLKVTAAMMHPRIVVTEGDRYSETAADSKGGPIAVCCSGETCIPVGEVGKLSGEIRAVLGMH